MHPIFIFLHISLSIYMYTHALTNLLNKQLSSRQHTVPVNSLTMHSIFIFLRITLNIYMYTHALTNLLNKQLSSRHLMCSLIHYHASSVFYISLSTSTPKCKSLTFCTLLRVFSTSEWSGCLRGVLLRMAKMSRGILVILCIGSSRNDCMLRFWHLLWDSSRFRYSRNITLFFLLVKGTIGS